MKKYILISLLFHLSFFLIFKNLKTLGNEKFNKIVPITFVASVTSPNPGAEVLVPKEVEKKEIPKPKEEKKEIKKEIKSKISDKKEKKVEEKKLEQPKQIDISKEIAEVKETKEIIKENIFQGSNFLADGDKGYIALSSEGINYEIINEVEPEYPSQAEIIGYSQKVIVTVKFLVGYKGNVENIEIVKSHKKLGFDDEVKKAIKKWRFKPIYHHGENIKVYFMKDFVFNPR